MNEHDGELHFLNARFLPGLNVTVRDGRKWAGAEPGWLLALMDDVSTPGPSEHVGDARVIHIQHVEKLEDVPDVWMALNHDPSATEVEGLREALNLAYGTGAHGRDGYTVVLFHVERDPGLPAIFEEVSKELLHARMKWGGSDEDDLRNEVYSWTARLAAYASRWHSRIDWKFHPASAGGLGEFRRSMVKAAGIAVSAIQWADRCLERLASTDA